MCHFFFVLQFYGLLPAQFCCLLLAQSTIFTASVQCLRNESAYSVLKNRFSTIFSGFFLPILACTSMFKSSVFQKFSPKKSKTHRHMSDGSDPCSEPRAKNPTSCRRFRRISSQKFLRMRRRFRGRKGFRAASRCTAPAVKQKEKCCNFSTSLLYRIFVHHTLTVPKTGLPSRSKSSAPPYRK